jgi:UDP-2-acetamido-3-amino-2,3-dideoxy-glucuronate N-acetyltransferase
MIGAGAVVISDVPDFGLVVGNPASIIGWVSREGERLYFDAEGIAVSGNPEQRYLLDNGKVFVI